MKKNSREVQKMQEYTSRGNKRKGPDIPVRTPNPMRFICWCGEPSGHDWPDKADGAPHPR